MGESISRDVLRDMYFDWLCNMVHPDAGLGDKYVVLLGMLFETPYRWTVPNDGDRELEGFRLRDEFSYDIKVDIGPIYCDPCSVLEMLIALARRMSYLMYQPQEGDIIDSVFWEFIDNLGLRYCTDEAYFEGDIWTRDAKNIVDIFLDRRYDYFGNGGIFPLKNPGRDQRFTDLVYQMNAYLLENFKI